MFAQAKAGALIWGKRRLRVANKGETRHARAMSRIKPLHLADLNPEQMAAVEHGAGPLLVIAGAGSGKTKTLACRVARLIDQGADPSRILLLTFSRRAASEMIARVGAVMAGDVRMPWAGTFHAIGARLLRELAPVIGLDPDFTIHDRGDSADLMGIVRHELALASAAKRFPSKGACLAIYSRAVNAEEPVADALAGAFPWCREWEAELKRLFAAYVQAKQNQNVLDYDDLLWLWAEAMNEPALASELGARFDHVLVDEYQDTNKLQARILMALKPDGQGLTVVGDDAQCVRAAGAACDAGAELPLNRADPGGVQCGDRPGQPALHEKPAHHPQRGRGAQAGERAR